MNNFLKEWVSAPIVIGLSILIATIIFSVSFYSSRTTADYISVTGSASKEVVSDKAKFSGNFSRIVKLSTLKTGYALMASDLQVVNNFLKEQKIDLASVTISTVSMEQNYDYNNNQTASEKDYTLRQNVEVVSTDIEKITSLAKSTQSLIDRGIIFSVWPVQYYYTNLPQVRVDLLADAVKDAQARAKKLAESTGKTLGSLQAAASGVVQVLPSNSLEISDYGTYDTNSVNKNIMVTVKASFELK
ncbi:MAG: SIMPL domain-containing protein [Minisyncoccia bacterium]